MTGTPSSKLKQTDLKSLFHRAINASPEEKARQKKLLDDTVKANREQLIAKLSKPAVVCYNSNLTREDVDNKNFDTLTVNGFNQKHVKELKAWTPELGFGYLLMGEPSLGKSHACKAMTNKWAMKGMKCHFDSMGNITTQLDSWKTAPAAEDMLKAVRFLVIDDFGAQVADKKIEDYLFRILEYRASKNHSTFMTTNMTSDELRTKLHKRITERLYEFFQVQIWTGNSFRRQIYKQNLEKRNSLD